jgi:hypothetical protein
MGLNTLPRKPPYLRIGLPVKLDRNESCEYEPGNCSSDYDCPFSWRRISFLMDSGRDSASRPSGT